MSVIHKGAIFILSAMVLPLLAWGGATLIDTAREVAILKAQRVSTKELILRIDKKADYQNTKLDKLDDKIDRLIQEIE